MNMCSVPGCTRQPSCRGYCGAHYQRWKAHGDPGSAAIIPKPTGPSNPCWKGGTPKGPGGRPMVYCPDYPGPKIAGTYVLAYRLEAEKQLGRRLRRGEVVHHLDGNPTEQTEKLHVCTQSEHARIHNETRNRNAAGQFTS